jgi:hypothetical protein
LKGNTIHNVQRFLLDRVSELDSTEVTFGMAGADELMMRFHMVMSAHTRTMIRKAVGERPTIPDADADAVVATSHLIASLAAEDLSIVRGPLARERQVWLGNSGAAAVPSLRSELFVAATSAPSRPSTKPVGIGLFTSTSTATNYGMWHLYIDSFSGSSLHPKPWQVWQVIPSVDITVLEITCAHDWVKFVENYPITSDGLVYPDWLKASKDIEAVHFTISAVASTQGLCFPTTAGPTAPTFWDVESTLWLNWKFASKNLIAIED